MSSRNRSSILVQIPIRPLAACLAAAFGIVDAAIANPLRTGNTIVVTNCDDSGTGSLR
jgi:hypothetical protein